MEHPLLHLGILLSVLVACTHAITITSNGNSPKAKMPAVSVKDIEFGGFVPINPFRSMREEKKYVPEKVEEKVKFIQERKEVVKFPEEKSASYLNNTKLPVNERYRRLIPYMTFYLANDFNSPQKEVFTTKPQLQNVFVPSGEAANGKQVLQYNNIPRYQGNRLTNFNIASAFPTKTIKDYYPQKVTSTKYIQPGAEFYSNTVQNIPRPPLKNIFQNIYNYQNPIPVPVKVNYVKPTEASRLQYYTKPKYNEKPQQYKLIPYEQTPPFRIPQFSDEEEFVPKVNPYYKKPITAPVTVTKTINNNIYQNQQTYQIPAKETYVNEEKPNKEVFYFLPTHDSQYDEPNNVEFTSEQPYRFKNPYAVNPVTESGFKPMINTATPTPPTKYVYITSPNYSKQPYKNLDYNLVSTVKPQLQYEIHTTRRPPVYTESSEDYADLSQNYGPSGDQYEQNNLAQILKTLQDAHSIPQKITADNVDSSIKTLVQIINNLKSTQIHEEDTSGRPIIGISSTYKPPVKPIATKHRIHDGSRFKVKPTLKPIVIHDYPSQDLDLETEHPGIQDIDNDENDSLDDDRGGTPGTPGVDYPIMSTIPITQFDCKAQRYKGFFGDPETNCQVWHYCDLNGGQASFLCPNGTVFSQVALTCDWWFNVKCDTTAQLYVLNERLYKYILPYTPKFPEDYSGPLVDKYLSIKYKEMEEEDKKKKEKEENEGKDDEAEEEIDQVGTEEVPGVTASSIEMEKVDVIEIKNSGMSGALRPYEDNKK